MTFTSFLLTNLIVNQEILQRQILNIDVLVLKQHHTIIYTKDDQKQLQIGGAYQATGGMGDVLAGTIAGFTAQFKANPTKAVQAQLVQQVLQAVTENQILIVDGSALTIMAEQNMMFPRDTFTIVTPHQMEWARLSGVQLNYQAEHQLNEAASAVVGAGAGLTTVATDLINLAPLHTRTPEAMFVDWRNNADLMTAIANSDVILMGPGMGTDGFAVHNFKFAF
ncbi:hypothetical protein H7R52_04265 [Weissella confusa]|uniref:YjeF C-terminal domain-containing protein n=1 Tax=Weissella confusa TaxID=1583 RepID=A0A923NIE8_WEICO|nr:hypothetical protein [Weissella confusa]